MKHERGDAAIGRRSGNSRLVVVSAALGIAVALGGCSSVGAGISSLGYDGTIQRGYMADPRVLEGLKTGLSKEQVLSQLGDDLFNRVVRYNKGLWANVLALGLRDAQLTGLVQTAWNVAAEARRMRQQWPGH